MQVESVRKGCISFQKDGKSFKRERISFAKRKSTIMREEQIDTEAKIDKDYKTLEERFEERKGRGKIESWRG